MPFPSGRRLQLVVCGPVHTGHVELGRAATLADLQSQVTWRLLQTEPSPQPEADPNAPMDPMQQFYVAAPEPDPEPEPEPEPLPLPASQFFCGRLNRALAPSAPGLEAFTPLESLGVRDGDLLTVRPAPTQELAKPAAQRLLTPRKRPPASRVVARAASEQAEPDWSSVVSEVGVAAGMQRLCAYKLAHLWKTPDDAQQRVAAGAKAVSELVTTLVRAGVTEGTEESRPSLERFCGHVQTTFFDGITAEVHGAELRHRCKQLNAMIESLVRAQKFN
eukprot:COSAG05_NODE_1598_length_4453_cov_5.666514_1_plen_276_part_00